MGDGLGGLTNTTGKTREEEGPLAAVGKRAMEKLTGVEEASSTAV